MIVWCGFLRSLTVRGAFMYASSTSRSHTGGLGIQFMRE